MTSCIFCDLAAKKRDPELTVFEYQHTFAQISLRQKPGNYGHVLVIPKRHVKNLYELPDELNAPLMAALRRLSRAVKSAYAAEGIHIRQNNEPAAGQDVFHLHFHVIPRYAGDNFDAKGYEAAPIDARREMAEKLKAAVRGEA